MSVRNGYYRRYFAKKDFDVGFSTIFFALRQRNTRRIVLHLLNHASATHKDLLRAFDLAPATLSLYLNNLVKKKVIERAKNGRVNMYKITDEQSIIKILRTYKESFVDNLVDRALEIYEESHF